VKAGKIATMILVLMLTAMAGAVSWFAAENAWIQNLHPVGRWSAVFGLIAISLTLVLVPLGMALDRTIEALQQSMLALAQGQESTSISGPRWLRPLTRSCLATAETFRTREKELRGQFRDQEIRQRVCEAELGQLRAVLNSLRDLVVVTDPFDEIIFINRAAAEVLDLDLEQAIRQPIDRVVSDQKLCKMVVEAREACSATDPRSGVDTASGMGGGSGCGAATHVEHELHAPRLDKGARGSARLYDVTLACVENHKRQVGAVVTILHDLTRERELSQMKSDFVSKASHELRTPLSSIRAYVEMLVDGEAADEKARHEFYKVIQNETERLGRMIDNMLNISRIEAGIVQIDRVSVDMKKLIARAVESLTPQADERRISLHARPVEVDLGVEGDADMLYQVVLNLVSNAVKYTPEGGRVTISADSDNLTRSVVVTVADTGLGIPPDAMPRLFDKFYRVEHMKRMAKGTGLGLNLCKHIVETVHHGQIGVESTLGMGSKFWFSIPMRYAGSQAAA
jgi:two-component system phosphate regulon sensor histidine kinase PhoR